MARFLSCILSFLAAAVAAETLTVYVTTEGPRQGEIDILVFTGSDGFPNRPEKAFRRVRVPVTGEGPVTCVITNLSYGAYSLSVLHDINSNGKADRMLGFGPPKEPVGFSNIHKKTRRQPPFESTVIQFSEENSETAVPLWFVL
jgi:uncharacterized protein (DUF2141 family)